jgi:hypothetical protein
MLKNWNELRAVDVSAHTKTKKIAGVSFEYLPWAKCIDLLHEHGAESVGFRPLTSDDGSFLFCSREVQTQTRDGKTRTTACYFVKVEIEIDGEKWDYCYPLVNGSNVIFDDTLNQNAINTAHARAFVKGVAIKTGLGWSLWAGEEEPEEAEEDLYSHKLFAIQKRLEERISALMARGMTVDEIAKAIGWTRKQLDTVMTVYFRGISALETELGKIR